ncbi:DUF418 domain-containing protein [uncultured Parasphingopyxis sp.]|uniref:DUF418 domain-containing protein n=1 Tax=uncultured Parasphingopyxis sp. TaxID=1547918 RepID=UPI00260ED4ED|nr:DUF418 domain-containing protein [uncultured Parasphingopyxis sp.]
MATTAPPPLDTRFVSLDLIRGIAVMGILLMNIVAFAMPHGAYGNPYAFGGTGPADLAVWATNFVIADGKMRGLFSVLFGASMLLVMERAQAKGDNPLLTHLSRMTWLLLFGAIHAYAIWFGDILMLYAVVGMVACIFRGMAAHRLLALGLSLIFAQAMLFGLMMLGIMTLRSQALAPDASADIVNAWADLLAQMGPMPPDEAARDLATYRGGYAGILGVRLGEEFWMPLKANGFSIIETLGLMLCGMAGLKSGFLTGEWERADYRRLLRIGYSIGLPAMVILAGLLLASGFGPVAQVGLGWALKTLFNPFVILGHASLVILWLKASPESRLGARIAAAGRMAFSNYLGTSLVCTTLFYGYGFGLYGEMSRAPLYLVVLAVWILMLLWSKPWLDRFRYGPLEWLWRSLARRELQKIRR